MPELPQTSHIKLEQRGPVLHLWLNRPEVRNALSAQMAREILATFAAIADDRSVRVVVLRGAGGTFCAGADLKNLAVAGDASPSAAAGTNDELKENNRRFGTMMETVNAAPQASSSSHASLAVRSAPAPRSGPSSACQRVSREASRARAAAPSSAGLDSSRSASRTSASNAWSQGSAATNGSPLFPRSSVSSACWAGRTAIPHSARSRSGVPSGARAPANSSHGRPSRATSLQSSRTREP